MERKRAGLEKDSKKGSKKVQVNGDKEHAFLFVFLWV